MSLQNLIEERKKSLSEMECKGMSCRHETLDRHFIISEYFHSNSINMIIEGVVEMVSSIEKNRCVDMGLESEKYVVVKKEDLNNIISQLQTLKK